MNTVVLYLPYAPPSWQVWSVSLRVPLHPPLHKKKTLDRADRRGEGGAREPPHAPRRR